MSTSASSSYMECIDKRTQADLYNFLLAAKESPKCDKWTRMMRKLSIVDTSCNSSLRIDWHVPVEQDDEQTNQKGASWLLLRAECGLITASIAARQAGLCDYTSLKLAYDIETGAKVDACANPSDFLAKHLERGRRLEPFIRDAVVTRMQMTFFPQGSYVRGPFLASPDGLLHGQEKWFVLEIKAPENLQKMEQLIPTAYIVQTTLQMYAMGINDAILAASSNPNSNLVLWHVRYSPAALQFIVDRLSVFGDHVMGQHPPPRDSERATRIAAFRSLVETTRIL